MNTFKLPDLGEGLVDAEIVAWHVSAGDHVVTDQPLLSVETAKAVVEIPSPWSGNILKLSAEVGDVVEIGAELVEFDSDTRDDPGAIVGKLPRKSELPKASPAVRNLAKQRGIDLSEITGSGPDGAITGADLDTIKSNIPGDIEVQPLRGVRRAMAAIMTTAGNQVVAATVTDEADINPWSEHSEIIIRLVRAIEQGVKTEPGLNTWYQPELQQRLLHSKIHLGIAVDTPDGLFAPVLRDITSRSDKALREGLEKLRRDVEQRSIPASELRDQTFTLSNFGMIGGQHASLVIVPPQVAILGAGRAAPKVVAVNGTPVVHKVLPLSLTFDHRVVTGGEAARFLRAVVKSLEREIQ